MGTRTVLFLALLITGKVWGDSLELNQSTTAYSPPARSRVDNSPWQFVVPSFVIHGIEPDPSVAADMPRKIGASGDAVVTPGLGFEYKRDSGILLMGAVIKDCFNDLAGTVQIGENFRINRYSSWGYSFGVYARESPLVCPNGPQSCYDIDGWTLKFTTMVNGESVDIIPMPFLHYSYTLYRTRQLQINFKVMANFFLNEFGFEIPI